MLRYGKPVAEKIEAQTAEWIKNHDMSNAYIAIVMLGEEHPWAAYVQSKIKCAERLGVGTRILWNQNREWTHLDIEEMIHQCNDDELCVGIMLQLPLPSHLQSHKQQFLDMVDWRKDVDALWAEFQETKKLLPATPLAVINIINHYEYDVQWKKIAMIGDSNLIGKPLAFALEYKWGFVTTFNIASDQEEMKRFCREEADMIISATGHIHLVDASFVRDDQSQVVIDVGRWYKDGKPAGDVNADAIAEKVFAYTPVPGGVGPVTVASLFSNLVTLRKNISS